MFHAAKALGLAFRLIGAIARRLVRLAARRHPGSWPEAWLLHDQGRFEEALVLLDAMPPERASSASPGMRLELRGRCLWMLGRREEALGAWIQAARAGDSSAIGSLCRGAVEAGSSSSARIAVEILMASPAWQQKAVAREMNVGELHALAASGQTSH